jgi:hypothetical protein
MEKFAIKLPFNFFTQKRLEVNFSGLDLSSDAGLLLVKQAEDNLKICEGISSCLEDNREQHKVKHPLLQLVSQRIYQIAAGYEDTNDSNYLRHDPIFKIICDKIPKIGTELLASQPTISRLENFRTQEKAHRPRRGLLGVRTEQEAHLADRLSCRKFIVNQFRLFLCQAA